MPSLSRVVQHMPAGCPGECIATRQLHHGVQRVAIIAATPYCPCSDTPDICEATCNTSQRCLVQLCVWRAGALADQGSNATEARRSAIQSHTRLRDALISGTANHGLNHGPAIVLISVQCTNKYARDLPAFLPAWAPGMPACPQAPGKGCCTYRSKGGSPHSPCCTGCYGAYSHA